MLVVTAALLRVQLAQLGVRRAWLVHTPSTRHRLATAAAAAVVVAELLPSLNHLRQGTHTRFTHTCHSTPFARPRVCVSCYMSPGSQYSAA